MTSEEGDNDVIQMFDNWCQHQVNVSNDLNETQENLQKALAEQEVLSKANSRLQTECNMLQEVVSACQKQLQCVCALQDEVLSLKQQMIDKEQTLLNESASHKSDMSSLQEAHKTETEALETNLRAEYEMKLSEISSQLKAETESRQSLVLELEEVRKEKDKELSRLTMEYENKLARAQRHKAQFVQQQQQVLSQDVLRKKMQFMKENYEQELANCKRQIEDLKHLLEQAHQEKTAKESRLRLNPHKQPKPQLLESKSVEPTDRPVDYHGSRPMALFRTSSGSRLQLQ